MQRRYSIWNSKTAEGNITQYFVTDISHEEQKRSQTKFDSLGHHEKIHYLHQEFFRPRIATFPVSDLYPAEEQRNRAKMLCDYLNKIQEAMERAESETAFIDVLTAGANINP